MENPSAGAALKHAEKRTVRHTEGRDEGNTRFSRIYRVVCALIKHFNVSGLGCCPSLAF